MVIKKDMNPVSSRMMWGMVFLFVVTICWMIFFQTLETAVAFSATDDGLYYPRLAQHIIERGVCTYDGVTVTNGFHPLWLICLLPIYGLIHNPWAALWGVYGVIFTLQLATLWLFSRIARAMKMTAAGWAAAIFILLINIRSLTIFFSFLESPLVLLVLTAYLVFCLRTGDKRFSNPWKAVLAGVLLGVCFLSRLDSFLFSIAFGAIWLVRLIHRPRQWRVRLFSAAAAAGGCLALVVPYLTYNWIQFGHLKTVSAWKKSIEISPIGSWKTMSSWSLHQFVPRVQHLLGLSWFPPGILLGAILLVGVLGVFYVCTGARRRRVMQLIEAFPEFFLFVLLHALFIVLAAPVEAAASVWYWVPEILLGALVAGVTLPNLSFFRIPLVPFVVLVLVSIQWVGYPMLVQRKTMSFVKIEVAKYLRKNTPPQSRGAMFDSGIVSYFSQRDFLGINGLIGDFKQAEMMKNREYAAAFERCGVEYLVLDTPERILKQFEPSIFYVSKLKTKFENFSEPPKPFVVYRGGAGELEQIWTGRYGGLR